MLLRHEVHKRLRVIGHLADSCDLRLWVRGRFVFVAAEAQYNPRLRRHSLRLLFLFFFSQWRLRFLAFLCPRLLLWRILALRCILDKTETNTGTNIA